MTRTTGPSLSRRPALGLAGAVAIVVVAVLAALGREPRPAELGPLGRRQGRSARRQQRGLAGVEHLGRPAGLGGPARSASVEPTTPAASAGATSPTDDHDQDPSSRHGQADDHAGGDNDD